MKCPQCNCELELKMVKDSPRDASAADHLDLEQLLESVDEDSLDEFAAKFVQQTKERFGEYGKRTRMSEKQIAWLRRIAAGDSKKEF